MQSSLGYILIPLFKKKTGVVVVERSDEWSCFLGAHLGLGSLFFLSGLFGGGGVSTVVIALRWMDNRVGGGF